MISRRDFLKYVGIGSAATIIPWKLAVRQAEARYYGVNSPVLQKFIDPMRLVGTDIPIMSPDGSPAPVTGVTHYTIAIRQFKDQLHSQLPTTTKLWGYGQGSAFRFRHIGGIIIATRNTPLQITFINRLTSNGLPTGTPLNHILPVDTTMPGANQAQNRVATHLHGGFVPWISDGGPFDWWAPDGTHGLSFLNNTVLNPGATTNEAEYYYPNQQTARLMWYHDHAFGITRLNAYAGVASGYVLDDPAAEAALFPTGDLTATNLRDTIYMVFQDKVFIPQTGPPANYPVTGAVYGDLFYAYLYDQALFGPPGTPSWGGTAITPFPVPSVVPEFFGDTLLVNGTAYPVLTLEARPYRFRMLNACNARFLNPMLVRPQGASFPNNTEPNTTSRGPSFLQIGTEGGYLPQTVRVNQRGGLRLLIAPAERADVLVNFRGHAGEEFILFNNAPGPFPGGAARFDFYPGNPRTPVSTPGYGPNTRTMLKIVVVPSTVAVVKPTAAALDAVLPTVIDTPLVTQVPGVPTAVPADVNVRQLTLNEGFDEYGRLAQFIGTSSPTNPGFFGTKYLDSTTEGIPAGGIEVWEFANLTADAHPIHIHLVNWQILSRQPFDVFAYNGTPAFTGPAVAPDDNELGWKETVRMNPGEVTRVIARFDLPTVPFTVPASPRTNANEYVFHCHILEHEEHDMMNPLVVV